VLAHLSSLDEDAQAKNSKTKPQLADRKNLESKHIRL